MQEIYDKTKSKMEKCLDSLERDYKSVRAGRANPAVLDRVSVDYYGTPTPINQMAAVSVPEPRMLMIQPWDMSTLKEIEKAINTSDIGINPSNDGKVIRLVFPPLTEERRKELVKDIAKRSEEAKIAIRNTRSEGNRREDFHRNRYVNLKRENVHHLNVKRCVLLFEKYEEHM